MALEELEPSPSPYPAANAAPHQRCRFARYERPASVAFEMPLLSEWKVEPTFTPCE